MSKMNILFKLIILSVFGIALLSIVLSCKDIQEQDELVYTSKSSFASPETVSTQLIDILRAFPNGAPPLNKTAEFQCRLTTHQLAATNISINVDLPEAFELVSGKLSWFGDVPANVEVAVINAKIKSVKTGTWNIDIECSLNAEENPGYYGDNYTVLVTISEDSANWRPLANLKLTPPSTISPDENLPPPPAITP